MHRAGVLCDLLGALQVDGVELHQVRLMGAIVEVTEHSTNTIFRIEDGTGRIDVKVFNDNDETVAQVYALAICYS
jgi:RecJ-like exonuclease